MKPDETNRKQIVHLAFGCIRRSNYPYDKKHRHYFFRYTLWEKRSSTVPLRLIRHKKHSYTSSYLFSPTSVETSDINLVNVTVIADALGGNPKIWKPESGFRFRDPDSGFLVLGLPCSWGSSREGTSDELPSTSPQTGASAIIHTFAQIL